MIPWPQWTNRHLLQNTGLHIAARLLPGAMILFLLLWNESESTKPVLPPSTSEKPVVMPTNNLDLRLVRLYLRAEKGWTDDDRVELAQLFTSQGEFERVARLNVRSEPDNGSLPALLIAAENQINAGDWEGAAHTLQSVLAINPEQPQANLWMGLFLIPDPEAQPFIEKATASEGIQQRTAAAVLGIIQIPDYSVRDVALRLVEFEEYAFAESLFTRQIEADNLDALSFAYRGFVRDQLGKDGLNDIQTAIALEPVFSLPYFMLGLHYRQHGDFDQSLQAFLDAHLLDPENPALTAEVASAYQLNDNLELAAEWYALTVSLASDDDEGISLSYRSNSTRPAYYRCARAQASDADPWPVRS